MTSSNPHSAMAFPENGTRAIFYLFYDPRGVVDEYVYYKLDRLRKLADFVFVVVNGELQAEHESRLRQVVDVVWKRPNVGFDVWGYKEALAEVGQSKLAEFDEIVLANYTWFGPVNPFETMFERMDPLEVDFWGMTDHGPLVPNPFTNTGILPHHIQSHWIAVRRSMFLSQDWVEYWANIPPIHTYLDSVLNHESKFTKHFGDLGYRFEVAFPYRNYISRHPAFHNAEDLLDDGCPALKRRPFFHDPLLLDREADVASRFIEKASSLGYPTELILENIARNSEPKIFNTNAALFEILPDVPLSPNQLPEQRIAVIMHVYYVDLLRELIGHVHNIPAPVDLFVTTTDGLKASVISTILNEEGGENISKFEIRVLPSNRGRDLSAFFIECRDVLRGREYDLIFKLHTKKTAQELSNAGTEFRRHQLTNLLNSKGYAHNLLELFANDPGLGMVFPPTPHIGLPTLGRGWYQNKANVKAWCNTLGIHVPLDTVSPLAPYGCMFVFRPEALRLLTDVDWHYKDYAPPNKHWDGSLAHVQERLFAYAVSELGYHIKTVANTRYAAISHTSLEYKLDRMSKTIAGYPLDQIGMLDAAGSFIDGGPVGFFKSWMKIRHPRAAKSMNVVYAPMRNTYRRMRRLNSEGTLKNASELEEL